MSDSVTEVSNESHETTYIAKKALDRSWTKAITAKHIEFDEVDGKKVWGVEYSIPLRFDAVKGVYEEILQDLARREGFEVSPSQLETLINKNQGLTWFKSGEGFTIPENIQTLRIVDLAPQEVLPRHLRNLKGKKNFWHDEGMVSQLTQQILDPKTLGALKQLEYSDPTSNRNEALDGLLKDVFGLDKSSFRDFQKVCKDSPAKEIVIVHAHGGYDTIIGEQEYMTEGPGAENQAPGNRIDLNKVLAMYQDKTRYASILVEACYKGADNNLKSVVRGYRPYGYSGASGHPFEIFFPKKTLSFGGNI